MLTYINQWGGRGAWGVGVQVWNNQPHHHQRTQGHKDIGQRVATTTTPPPPRKEQNFYR